MKSFFRRLHSKKEKQKESNYHQSPNTPAWPSLSRKSLPGSVGSVNPTFSDFHQHTDLAADKNLNSADHQGISFNNAAANTVHSKAALETQTQLPTTPGRDHNYQPAASLPASTPEARQPSSSHRSTAKFPSNITHTSSPSQGVRLTSPQPQHVSSSIYKTFNDFNIMSSGRFDFDDNPLLASAPSADWLTIEERPTNRLPERPRTADDGSSRSSFAHQWDSTQVLNQPRQQQQARRAGQPSNAKLSIPRSPVPGSPPGSAEAKGASYMGPSPVEPMPGIAPSAQGALPSVPGLVPSMQPMSTPFAKYANKAMSQALFSGDLDTAMRPNEQMADASQGLGHDSQSGNILQATHCTNASMAALLQRLVS